MRIIFSTLFILFFVTLSLLVTVNNACAEVDMKNVSKYFIDKIQPTISKVTQTGKADSGDVEYIRKVLIEMAQVSQRYGVNLSHLNNKEVQDNIIRSCLTMALNARNSRQPEPVVTPYKWNKEGGQNLDEIQSMKSAYIGLDHLVSLVDRVSDALIKESFEAVFLPEAEELLKYNAVSNLSEKEKLLKIEQKNTMSQMLFTAFLKTFKESGGDLNFFEIHDQNGMAYDAQERKQHLNNLVLFSMFVAFVIINEEQYMGDISGNVRINEVTDQNLIQTKTIYFQSGSVTIKEIIDYWKFVMECERKVKDNNLGHYLAFTDSGLSLFKAYFANSFPQLLNHNELKSPESQETGLSPAANEYQNLVCRNLLTTFEGLLDSAL